MRSPEYITATYNTAVAALKTQLNTTVRRLNIQIRSVIVRRNFIAAAIRNANIILANLTKQYQRDLASVQQQPKKTALLVGINYVGTSNELYGCINDTKNVRDLLQSKYGFTNIVLLNDDSFCKPTKQNILNGFRDMLINAKSGDTVFFMYSGHGTNTYDFNGDELDGKDEMIVPIDATTLQTCILDDELNTLIRTNIKPGVKLLALFDSCFSGTMLDLRYTYNKPDCTSQPETAGDVIMISGCTDSQTSADTVARIYGRVMPSGAMTYAFLANIGGSTSMQDLVTKMNVLLQDNGYSQRPLLSSGRKIDYNNVLFL